MINTLEKLSKIVDTALNSVTRRHGQPSLTGTAVPRPSIQSPPSATSVAKDQVSGEAGKLSMEMVTKPTATWYNHL